MKRVGKPVFFTVFLLIVLLTYLVFFGIGTTYGDITKTVIKSTNDIRWGIDIRGGVDVTFTPPEGFKASKEQMAAAESIIKVRLVSQNITDYEVYTDYNKNRIIVRFPWKANEVNFNPETAIKELGDTAMLTFRPNYNIDADGKPTGETASTVIIEGKHVNEASAVLNSETNQPVVALKLNDEGAKLFAAATQKYLNQSISIWMDDTNISNARVETVIPSGEATIEGNFTIETAKALADKINAGALPFKLKTENYNAISPTLGANAKDAMVLAGIVAYILVCVLMIGRYRLPGIIAAIGLLGQISGSLAAVTGFFPVFPSFTLTLPGIAGIILSIGMGVDANVITTERIREELRIGKTVEGSIDSGYDLAFSAIFDGNITVIIVAVILMGSFGSPNSIFGKMLSPLFRWFGQSTAGTIYSFGYTLLIGSLLNFIMGVTACKYMMKSIVRFKAFKNPWLYGGVK